MKIKEWIGEPVAVNRRDEQQIVGLLAAVDKLGVTLTRAGARGFRYGRRPSCRGSRSPM